MMCKMPSVILVKAHHIAAIYIGSLSENAEEINKNKHPIKKGIAIAH